LASFIGIQGLFEALRKIILHERETKELAEIDFKQSRFEEIFSNVSAVDFTSHFYQQFSAVGKSNITETILLLNGFVKTPDLDEETQTILQQERIKKKIEQHSIIRAFIK
jgi:hypothetical protein